MPDFWTHTIAIRKVIDTPVFQEKYPQIIKQPEIHLGTHGPDIFFYVNTFRLGKKKFASLGNVLHSQKIKDELRFILQYAQNRSNAEIAYLTGFIAHYMVDSICHPFVYANSTNSNEHKYLEVNIDSYILAEEKHNTKKLKSMIVKIPEPDFEKNIAPFYKKLFSEIYHVEVDPKDFIHAGSDEGKVMESTLSPFLKNFPKKLISKIIGYDATLMFLPDTPDPKFDYPYFINLLAKAIKETEAACLDFLSIVTQPHDSTDKNESITTDEFIDKYVNFDFNGNPL